ncbi:MAG: SPFH domain-containing protein [Planctomycetota bacterium]|nr:SPFH domain-containing protein [Planctomycetota bacterium]
MFDIFSMSAEALYIVIGVVSAIVKASGVTVLTGQTGLLYTVGRTDRPVPLPLRPLVAALQSTGKLETVPRSVLRPGFHPLIPFLQRVRKVPTRSRTLDLPAQTVATFEGYVFIADANIVFRIVDVHKALIQVDDLLRGMEQMLTLGVKEILREATLRELQSGQGLDERLRLNLEARVAVWGVTVERAGFPSITPSPRTLRITQLRQKVEERERRVAALTTASGDRPLSVASALGAVGSRRVFRTRTRAQRRRLALRSRDMRVRQVLQRRGHGGAAIDRAVNALR